MHSERRVKSLARSRLERRLAPLRRAGDLTRPVRGWIKAVREALGMTTAQLGRRIDVSQSRVTRIERAEAEEAITLRTLRRAAEGLNCTLVYALVPNEPLDDILQARARAAADRQLARADHAMKLENQRLDARDLRAERARLLNELTAGDPRRLWDEP